MEYYQQTSKRDISKMTRYLRIILPIFLFHGFCFGSHDELQRQFNLANESFKSEDYNQAIEVYEQLVSEGYKSAEIFSNLGTAHLKIGQIGPAVLNLEKAILLDNGNKTARQNLSLAKEQIASPVSIIPDFVVLALWRKFVSTLSVRSWLIFHGIALFVSVLLLASLWSRLQIPFVNRVAEHPIGKGAIVGSFVLSIALLWMAIERKDQITQINYGVVMDSSVKLFNGPDERSTVVVTVEEGNRVKHLDEIDEWYKVQLDDKDEAWIKSSNIKWIRID